MRSLDRTLALDEADMKLTTKGRFAVTAMIDLALRHEGGPVTLAGISERQKISLSYLEQLFGRLRRHQLVASVRGPGGGYCLARKLAEISVADIISAVDEPLDATLCGGMGNCHEEEQLCMTHQLWSTLTKHMFDYLDSVSLADLVAEQKAKQGVAAVNDQCIVDHETRRPRRAIALVPA
jgi:Rrf2 family iron-sulfur cluster assembly transcriptional regulator